MKKVSIIIPVYNELRTVKQVIDSVKAASLGREAEKEIIVVDDGSKDGTGRILKTISDITVITLPENQGKGAALKAGFLAAQGDIVLIQDADLEYDVGDYPRLLAPFFERRADVVFGNRFHGEKHTVTYLRNYIGNKFLTLLTNLCTGLHLGDIEVGYKVFRKEVIDELKNDLQSKRFGIEPELVCKVARQKKRWKITEVPVNYYGRTYKEGKKIHVWDGIKAILAIIYFRFF